MITVIIVKNKTSAGLRPPPAHRRRPATIGAITCFEGPLLDRDLLLPLAAVAIECIQQEGIGTGKLVRLAQVLAMSLECLLGEHGAPVALHGSIV